MKNSMQIRWFLMVIAGALACNDDAAGPGHEPPTYSGTYYVAIGGSPLFTMELDGSDDDLTFQLTGAGQDIEGTGSIAGDTMSLAAEIAEGVSLTIEATLADEGSTFEGTWEFPGDRPSQGTITGTRTPWPTYDVDTLGIPQLATANAIDLAMIAKISRFRSGFGHDFSDDFESCRSMKHYFEPPVGGSYAGIALYSPVDGTIVGTTDEWSDPRTWKGQAVGIRVSDYAAFHVVIFHVDPTSSFAVGDTVTAGQQIGTSAKRSGTAADVAFGVSTPTGHRLISFFEVVTDEVFGIYEDRGIATREATIITQSERDADPLICEGEEFVGPGNLPNMIDLDD